MVKKTQWIWYRTSLDVEFAFLYNCRQRDLADGTGISKGVIVEGKYGFVATEALVPKVTGKIVPFNPNRRCKWEGLELRCQAILTAPAGQPVPVKFNYIVAALPDLSAQQI